MKRQFTVYLLAAALPALAACSSTTYPSWYPGWLRPYRPDVQQGNIVTKNMVEQLRPGMSRDQVKFLLGTPMLIDIFHQDRWDYPYYLRRRSGEVQKRRLWVVFEDGKLASFKSDPMPTEPLADTLILGVKSAYAEPTPLAAPPAQSPATGAPASPEARPAPTAPPSGGAPAAPADNVPAQPAPAPAPPAGSP